MAGSRPDGKPDGPDRYYAVPCKTNAPISFRFGGKNWAISAADLAYGVVEPAADETQMCVGAFFASDAVVIGSY